MTAYQFPESISAIQPTGTSSLVFTGYSSLGSITRTEGLSGSYIFSALSSNSNTRYVVWSSTNNYLTEVTNNFPTLLNFSSSEPNLVITQTTNWTTRSIPFATQTATALTIGNNVAVVVGDAMGIATSTDGITWTSRVGLISTGSGGANSVVYGAGRYAMNSPFNNLIQHSTDGITWATASIPNGAFTVKDLSFANTLFFATFQDANRMSTSTDGITWTTRNPGFGTALVNHVAFGAGVYVAVGTAGTLTTSTNGVTWTVRTSNFGTTQITNVLFARNLFIAAGPGNSWRVSTDGITWTTRVVSPLFSAASRSLTWINGVYYTEGGTGQLMTSTNGITWTTATYPAPAVVPAPAGFANGTVVSAGGTVMTSNTFESAFSLYRAVGTLN